MKICVKCKTEKPFSEFHKSKASKDGHCESCKSCRHTYSVEYHKKHTYPKSNIETKKCIRCKTTKSISSFGKDKHRPDGYTSYCFECRVLQRKEEKERNPLCNVLANKRIRYGLSESDYNRMLDSQNHTCAICGKQETMPSRYGTICALSVDHNHKTNKVRGLLCQDCNHGIGNFLDSIELLENAIEYLKKHQD